MIFLDESLKELLDELPFCNEGLTVEVANPVVLATTRLVLMTELYTLPFEVYTDVVVDGMVSDATRAEVMVVALDKVERWIVEEPTTTSSAELLVLDDATAVEVVIR